MSTSSVWTTASARTTLSVLPLRHGVYRNRVSVSKDFIRRGICLAAAKVKPSFVRLTFLYSPAQAYTEASHVR